MSTDTTTTFAPYAPPEAQEDFHQYRSLSASAVVSLLLGVISLLGFVSAPLVVLGLLAMAMAVFSLVSIRRSQEYGGTKAATIGLVCGLATLLVAGPRHAYIYATEVPPDHQRVYFEMFQPDERRYPGMAISPEVLNLDGKKVFIKGYLHPSAGNAPVQRFVLVRDMGTCCFGGPPKPSDMIDVQLSGDLHARWSPICRSVSGVLHVNRNPESLGGVQHILLHLDADQYK